MCGDLTIVPSQELDALGGLPGIPAEIELPWYWAFIWIASQAAGVFLWVLVPALLLRKDNRAVKACVILVPLLLVGALPYVLLPLKPVLGPAIPVFCHLALACVMSVGAALLLAPVLARISPLRATLAVCTILTLVGVAVGLSALPGEVMRDEYLVYAYAYALGGLTLLLGAVAARAVCRKRPTSRRFRRWMLATTFVVSALLSPVAMIAFTVVQSHSPVPGAFTADKIAAASLAGGVLTTGGILTLLLPMFVLLSLSKFYQARFNALLRLEPAAGNGDSAGQ